MFCEHGAQMNLSRGHVVLLLSALIAVFAIGVLGYWGVSLLNRQAALADAATLQQLTCAADINATQAEGFARTLLALQTSDPTRRADYLRQIAEFSSRNDRSIENYRSTLRENAPAFDRLLATRQAYVTERQAALALAAAGQQAEALALADGKLWTAYSAYTAAGDALVAHDVALGRERAGQIRGVATRIKWIAIGLCLAVFIAGLAAPYFALLSVAKWFDNAAKADRGY